MELLSYLEAPDDSIATAKLSSSALTLLPLCNILHSGVLALSFTRSAIVTLTALWPLLSAPGELPASAVPGKLRVLIVTGGHAFEEAPFFAMFDRMPEVLWLHVRYGQDAEQWLVPTMSSRYDALVMFDMNQKRGPHCEALAEILRNGKPTVFLHHSLGSYPEWPDYGQLLGGRANFGGKVFPGVPNTKFRHDTWIHVEIADKKHPITEGLRDFDIYDETYSNYAVSPDAHVLLKTDHPASDRAIGWTHRYGKSRVVYLEPGHGPQVYSHPVFEALLRRSLLWTAGKLGEPAK